MEAGMDHEGGCRCGAVRYRVRGEPEVVGVCHCGDCRKATGSAFLFYGDWRWDRFEVTGAYATWGGRSFCPVCGSRLFHLDDDGVEICLGSLDAAPTGLAPGREIWVKRREAWLPAADGAARFEEDAR
jgi:hypothetical protein